MTQDLAEIRGVILRTLLPNIAFDGWTDTALARAAVDAGYSEHMGPAAFPGGIADLLAYFAADIDRQMLEAVPPDMLADMRVRDRIAALVNARYAILNGVAEAERLAIRYWSVPRRARKGARLVWRTADAIWRAAGDTATDYNYYTKRGLLAGVLASTTLAWLRAPDSVPAFVARRIENVMQAGRLLGKIAPGSRKAQDDGAAAMKHAQNRWRTTRVAILVLALAGLSLPARPAHASLQDMWNKVFPPADTGPKPEDTLVAPFADPNEGQEKKVDSLYADPGADERDLSQPNRQQAEIAQWLSHALPDIFEIEPDKYDEHMKLLATGMNDSALAQYKTFMQNSNILKTLSEDHLALHAFVEEQPILLNSMAMDGRYRWLFEVPVTLTFLASDAKSYEQAGVAPVNQHVIVRLQVGRMPHGQGIDDLQIETFEVRQNTETPASQQTNQQQ